MIRLLKWIHKFLEFSCLYCAYSISGNTVTDHRCVFPFTPYTTCGSLGATVGGEMSLCAPSLCLIIECRCRIVRLEISPRLFDSE